MWITRDTHLCPQVETDELHDVTLLCASCRRSRRIFASCSLTRCHRP